MTHTDREPGTAAALELVVEGMTCAACAARVEKKLNKVDGVHATVNYATERAIVEGPLAEDEAIAVVQKAGYDARPVPTDASELGQISTDRVTMLRRRLALAAILTIPLGDLAIVLALVPHLRFPMWEWVCVLMAIPVVFWCAAPFHKATWRNLQNRSFSMDTLVSLGVLSAFSWSLISIIIGSEDTSGYWLGYGITPAGADTIYFEVAAAVTTFLLAGRYFEARARRNAQGVLGALNALAPTQVRVRTEAGEQLIPIAELKKGQEFVVRAGESLAADGVVAAGASTVDTSAMTGEPVPAEVVPGSTVLAGTVNTSGRLIVTATGVGAHTQLSQMAVLAQQAQIRKARVQQIVDKVVGWFVPTVLVISALTLAGWFLTGHGVRPSFSAAMSVLIIACPCAMGLATPTALMVGVGRGSQLGILIKGQDALEASGQLDAVVLDKTGTITEGAMQLEAVHALSGFSEDEVRAYAAAIESHSDHPLARAITEAWGDRPVVAVDEFVNEAGLGAHGRIDGRPIVIGNEGLLERHGVRVATEAAALLTAARDQGRTPVLLAVDGTVAGVLDLSDAVKDSAVAAIERLKRQGLRTILLTGDHEAAAAAVARQVRCDDWIAGVLPADKAKVVAGLQSEGRRVAMVGDGINDAAALATADLGMALVTGTDIAMKSADVILVRDNLNVVPDAIALSRATLRTIRGNLFWAFGYNLLAIPLAASGLLNPLIAGLAMSLSSLFVVGNSLRLRGRKLA